MYKHKRAVIPFNERMIVVQSCRYVDVVVPQDSMDKKNAWDRYKFDVMFVGDDWFQNDKWKDFEKEFGVLGVKIIYIPYTKGTSSTLINETLTNLRK
jgi:glycerol-3-phosphate cytidylyltransferase-like family protein